MHPHQFEPEFVVFERQTEVPATQTHLLLNVAFDAGLNVSGDYGWKGGSGGHARRVRPSFTDTTC
jgi:hypothetical protein